jgi:hypothetical protein
MKKVLIACCLLLVVLGSYAQKTYRVGIFAPLYLDSVFNESSLRTAGIPKLITGPLDFVQGSMIALDSLSASGQKIEAFIYDTKSFTDPLSSLIESKELENLDLMIGSVRDQDYKDLAEFANKKKIPFISATLPNDGGIMGNPYLAIVNSTLKSHCEGIFNYLVQNHGTDKIYLIKKNGTQETKIAGYFKALNEQEGKPLLKMQVISIDSFISTSFLRRKLDTTSNIVVIGGSLDEEFARNLVNSCFAVSKQKITLIGMPDWDGVKDFYRKELYPDFPILYTTPHYYSNTTAFDSLLNVQYQKRYKIKPSDMAYKGFENTFAFVSLVMKYPKDFFNHINDKEFTVFHEFNFKPVNITNGLLPDYDENKHVFIMKIENGGVQLAN